MPRILITTDYLGPGDEVDARLRAHGHTTVHAPMVGRRDPEQLVAVLDGIDAALVANEPSPPTSSPGRPDCGPSYGPVSATTPSTSSPRPGSASR